MTANARIAESVTNAEAALLECVSDLRSVKNMNSSLLKDIIIKLKHLTTSLDSALLDCPEDTSGTDPKLAVCSINLGLLKGINQIVYNRFGVPLIELQANHPSRDGCLTNMSKSIAAKSIAVYQEVKEELQNYLNPSTWYKRGLVVNEIEISFEEQRHARSQKTYQLLNKLLREESIVIDDYHKLEIKSDYGSNNTIHSLPIHAAVSGSTDNAKALKKSIVDKEKDTVLVPVIGSVREYHGKMTEPKYVVFKLSELAPEIRKIIKQ